MNKDRLYIDHIIDCISKVEEMSTAGKENFLEDYKTRDAILRNLQIMAESTQRLSDEFKKDITEINWRKISSFRNVMVHEYMGLDIELIWKSIQTDLPNLKEAIIKNKDK